MKIFQIIATFILFMLYYSSNMASVVQSWTTNSDFSHGFFIPFLSAYFIWRKKSELKNIEVSPSAWGLLIIIFGLLISLVGRFGQFIYLVRFSMLVVLFGLVYAQAGWQIARKTAFSIFYLIFAIPFPEFIYNPITFNLGLFSTKLSYFVIKLFGVSASREGNIINLPTCQLIVAAPCSGLRSLITFMAASLAIGYISQKTISKRMVLFLSSIFLAILMNMLRLVSTAIVANIFKFHEIPQSVHDATGIIAVMLGFIFLFLINKFLAKKK